ncbi:MAG TPA: choice-of-anchor P family protein [Terriglobales bacterium]|nr:choice-of-anchor P family protein [Terriglobales bacterium]
MNTKKNATIAICLTGILAFSPLTGFAQAATTFSGEAAALKASALGISVSLADTGPLPSSGGNLSTSVGSVNVAGLASADALRSTSSGSGTSSQSQSRAANVSLLGGLVSAAVVKSNSSATCSGSTASTSGNAQIINLVAAGQSIVVSNPNLAISLPGGISLIVNEQTSSSGGNSGSMTVNALHVTGPGVDIVVASAHSDITC